MTHDNGTTAKATLHWMIENGLYTLNYFLGGAINAITPNATAVHPSVRESIWNMGLRRASHVRTSAGREGIGGWVF